MKFIRIATLSLLIPLAGFTYTDESHYSSTFETTRFFRVFTPPDYDAANSSKRYPVIYYFHGCGGSYERSGTYSYKDYGLTPPTAIQRPDDPAFEHANNADFENVAYHNDVIIVSVDGRIEELPEGCKVYFPSLSDSWDSNYYNFSVYIRELIKVVDARYNTKTGPQYRAVSGLSMGGQMAIWVAATNPHLFNSASQFCHSPHYYDVGAPAYITTIDVKQLWRNLRGMPFRHTTTDRDYLRYYTAELFSIYSGAGFDNEYYLADLCHHAAARVDLQFAFHINHFMNTKESVSCFSHVNLYPEFEIWGYELTSAKKGNGWIYLHDVTKNGLGIYTRQQLPWGKSLEKFDIAVTTPAHYAPNKEYTLSRYAYRDNVFTSQKIKADAHGKLHITSSGGAGEEIGIIGDELEPPVFVLTDTINENIYLQNNVKTSLSFDVVNLSKSSQTVEFKVFTQNTLLLTIDKQPKRVTIPAQSKITMSSFLVCSGTYLASLNNTGYLHISSSIDGILQQRTHIIQVNVKNQSMELASSNIKIFDGKTEELPLFKYDWNEWDNPMSSGVISEGTGNGNGKVEPGEIFSVWIQMPTAFDSADNSTWHPAIPIGTGSNGDVVIESIKQHSNNTGRNLLSAQMRLQRAPTKDDPVRIPLQSELLKVQYLENDCHRNTADNFKYSYCEMVIYEDGSVSVDPSD